MNFLINVISHEVGHGTGALPQYVNDAFPLGSILNPKGAEPGTIMEQGVSPDVFGAGVRSFAEEDAELLRRALNEEGER